MLFFEPLFLFVFFPLLFACYLALSDHVVAKKLVLFVGSALFYSWGEPVFVPILFVSSLLDWRLTQRIAAARNMSTRHTLVTIGVTGNLLILIFYKYIDFIIGNLNDLLTPLTGKAIPLLGIALPIGVSFVVFEKITYLVDVYRKTSRPAPSFLDYGLFVFFFPKLLAGPILKYHDMQAQIAKPAALNGVDVYFGAARFARGIAKKILLADPLGTYVDQVFATDPGSLDATTAWIAVSLFYLQIYFDFSGYSDMALGLARMLSFELKENFKYPLTARSMTEFWRRWHISLSTWIRDYLYVALGRNRLGPVRYHINLWICFILCGLWHGANWTYVVWGAYNGLFLTLDRLFLLKWLRWSGPVVANMATLLICIFGLAIFRSPTIHYFSVYALSLTGWGGSASVPVPGNVAILAAVGAILALVPGTPLYGVLERLYASSTRLRILAAAFLIALGIVGCGQALSSQFKPFIYFRF